MLSRTPCQAQCGHVLWKASLARASKHFGDSVEPSWYQGDLYRFGQESGWYSALIMSRKLADFHARYENGIPPEMCWTFCKVSRVLHISARRIFSPTRDSPILYGKPPLAAELNERVWWLYFFSRPIISHLRGRCGTGYEALHGVSMVP